jgi:uncharacterized membrane protein
MSIQPEDLAKRLLRSEWERLSHHERAVISKVLERIHPQRDIHEEYQDQRTFGERLADKVAELGGSWAFITIFLLFLVAWAILNTVLMQRRGSAFDPYPFIFLNLILSMVAAIQAPIIMMSQNRQSVVDRMAAANDYEVNLRAELGVRALIDRLDELQRTHQQQLELLRRIVASEDHQRPEAASGLPLVSLPVRPYRISNLRVLFGFHTSI